MSAFHQDPFLGSFAGSSDVQALIDELSGKVLHLVGSQSITGPLPMSSGAIIGAGVVEVNELASGVLPPTGQVSIYAKTDKMLYFQDDTSAETKITGGNVAGPGSAIDNSVCVFDGTSGKLIKDGGDAIPPTGFGDVVGPGSSVNNRSASFSGTTGKLIKQSTAILDSSANLTGLNGLGVSGTSTIDLTTINGSATAIRLFSSLGGIRIEGETGIQLDSNSSDIDIISDSGLVSLSANLGLQVKSHGSNPGDTTEIRMLELLANGTNYTGFTRSVGWECNVHHASC
jgi:hypothetical protein